MGLEDVIEALDVAFAKDQVFVGEKLLAELRNAAEEDGAAKRALEDRKELAEKIDRDAATTSKLIELVKSHQGWKLATRKPGGFEVRFRQSEESGLVMTKSEATLPKIPGLTLVETFVALVSLYAETDLMPKWFPRGLMENQKTLLEETAFSRFTRIRIALPLFLGKRETCIHGKGYDMTDRNALAISFKSLDRETFQHKDFQVPEVSNGYKEMYLEGMYFMELMPDSTIRFSQLMMLNLNFRLIPVFIMNALSKGRLPYEAYCGVTDKLKGFKGGPWEKRVIEKRYVYEDIEQRLIEHVSQMAESPKVQANSAHSTNGESAGSATDDTPDDGTFKSFLRTLLTWVVTEERATSIIEKGEQMIQDILGSDAPPPPPPPPPPREYDVKPPAEALETLSFSQPQKSTSRLRRSLTRLVKRRDSTSKGGDDSDSLRNGQKVGNPMPTQQKGIRQRIGSKLNRLSIRRAKDSSEVERYSVSAPPQ